MNLSVMPIYENSRTNIFNDNDVRIISGSKYGYPLNEWQTKGSLTNEKHSWNLEKGTYYISVVSARGRYSFNLSSEDTNELLGASKLTNISSTDDGIKVDYEKADNATGYGIYGSPVTRSRYIWHDPSLDSFRVINDKFPDVLTQTIPKNQLINGETYDIAVRTMNNNEGKSFGSVSSNQEFTYYIPLKGNREVPKTPTLKVSYYDDHGSDEPYIDIDWNVDSIADSHEIQYRLKGSNKWASFFSKQSTGDEVDDPTNDFGQDFKKRPGL